ncbi:uncharacterized protein LOC129721064 [Wyeomyia smithii]|uniref:uncharacterized protein LOC129721064 n=1 Tax=Wyeomyia smithii TaxID=174621 RepID=UPI002467F8F0|nr:uncharacterized protein LOC129721064 [Wyeomyia smithii]
MLQCDEHAILTKYNSFPPSTFQDMENSSQDVIESSQKSGRRGRIRVSKTSATKARRSQRVSKAKMVKGLETLVDTATGSTEESSANVSGSLFNGQYELLKQYQDHETILREYDVILEEVLEQSRKAYEKMQLQSRSQDVFSMDTNQMSSKSVEPDAPNRGISQHQKDLVQNRNDVSVQTNVMQPKLCTVAVQVTPTGKCCDRQNTVSTSTNTETISFKDATNQTISLESRDVGVQKYHITRLRDASVQAMIGNPLRITAKRNVSIQRTSKTLDLNDDCALQLAAELKCDPARLLWLMLRMSAKQQNFVHDDSLQSTQTSVEFSSEDPYWANYNFFLGESADDRNNEGLNYDQMTSCCVEDFIV